MCIVTYVPYSSGFIFTSNRDENPNRPTEIPTYHYQNNTIQVYPKDEVAGGSWFGINLNHNIVASLLNAQPRYFQKRNKSRGKFLIEYISLIRNNYRTDSFQPNSLVGLPPFELIHLDFDSFRRNLVQYYWDGNELKNFELDSSKPHLWSSLSLYSREKQQHYLEIFHRWLRDTETMDQKKVIRLHHDTFAQDLHSNNFFQHQQKLRVKTVSVISLMVNMGNYEKSLSYQELDSGQIVRRKFC